MNRKMLYLVLLFGVFANACGSIPKAYQGYYQDQNGTATLELKSGGGTFKDEEGTLLESKAFSLKYKDLDKGKEGIYVSKNPKDQKILDVFWIRPVITSRQEEAGLVWYDADVAHTYFDTRLKKQEQVSELELVRCRLGRVMLDAETQRWQVGCPADVKVYGLRKTEKPKEGTASLVKETESEPASTGNNDLL